jgi:hypothetical protein
MQERAKNNTQRIKFKLQQISGFELQQYLNWLGFIFIFLEGDPATVIKIYVFVSPASSCFLASMSQKRGVSPKVKHLSSS